MKILLLAVATLSSLILSACDQQPATPDKAKATAGSRMGTMPMPAEPKQAKSTGIVAAIDKAAGKMTLEHEPIAGVGWPAMTMAFAAKPAILDTVRVGDRIAFDVTIKGNGGEVTGIRKF